MKYPVRAYLAAALIMSAALVAPGSAQSPKDTKVLLNEARQYCAAQARAFHPYRLEQERKHLAGYQEILAKREQELAREGKKATDWDRRRVTSVQAAINAMEKGGPDSPHPAVTMTPLDEAANAANNMTAAELAKEIRSREENIEAIKRNPPKDGSIEYWVAWQEQRSCVYALRYNKLKGLALDASTSAPVTPTNQTSTPDNTAKNKKSAASKDKQRKVHNPAADAKGCTKLTGNGKIKGAVGSGWQLTNNCGVPIEAFWCFVDAPGKCQRAGTWSIRPGGTWPIQEEGTIRWGACKGRNSGGMVAGSAGQKYICPQLTWESN